MVRIWKTHWKKLLSTVLLLSVVGGAATALVLRPDLRKRVLSWIPADAQAEDTDSVYWCPMHPDIKRHNADEPCPICNMALVKLEFDFSNSDEEGFVLTAQQTQQAGVVVRPVAYRQLYRELDTTGRLDFDERRLKTITSWVSGKSRIQKLLVNFTGEVVRENQVLAEIYSPGLITAQQEYLVASQRPEQSRPSRFSHGDLREAAREKLLNQGVTRSQIDQLGKNGKTLNTINVHAPISGTVIKRYVQEGQYVDEGDMLFQIADLSHLWLLADAFEEDLELVEVGQTVDLSVRSIAGERFQGTVSFIDPVVQPKTRSVRVRVEIDNSDGRLKPGMYARARIRSDFPQVLAVPENAVLWSGERQVVIVQTREGHFQPQEVRLGSKWLLQQRKDEDESERLSFNSKRQRYHQVVDGLAPGDEVVVAGAFLLNAESQFQSVTVKMLPPTSELATLEEVLNKTVAKELRTVLDAYYGLSQSLADDNLEAVVDSAAALHKAAESLNRESNASGIDTLGDSAAELSRIASKLLDVPKDMHHARTVFGRISHALIRLTSEHGGKTLLDKDLFVFECGMSGVGYEKWLWWGPQKLNPYMGKKMPTCGRRLTTLTP
jgi:Cu(I)/Ag(I) efflux system membrane fusion protein